MYAAHPNHGQTVRWKATSVRLVMIGVVRCISGPAASSLSDSIAPPRRRVLRTRTLPARPLLDQVLSSATSHVAMVTTVTLAQLCSSVLSSCWHADWRLCGLLSKTDIHLCCDMRKYPPLILGRNERCDYNVASLDSLNTFTLRRSLL